MLREFIVAAAAACVGFGGFAASARADYDPTKKMIQEEIKAYLKAEKEKKDKEDKEKGTMKVSWKDGVSFESADKKFKAKLIGRIQTDMWTFSADEDLEAAVGDEWNTALYFRRARLGIDMRILNTQVKAEYDFARGGSNSAFADVFVALRDLDDCGMPFPDVTVGHFKEPFSLDELTSSKYSTFIERAAPVLTFAPARNTGIMLEKGLLNWSTGGEKPTTFDRLLLQAGVFHAFSNNFGDGVFSDGGANEFDGDQDGWAATGRVVFVPWFDCNCPECRVVHLGAAVSYRADLQDNNLRFRTRPEVGVGPRPIDTGADVDADSLLMAGFEAAVVYDRFSAQGEYILCNVDVPLQGDPTYSGWYAQASYWLTGECRNYKKGAGYFDRVKPCKPFFCEDCCAKGGGGWEVAVRYSNVDLDDGVAAVRGGVMDDITVGLNWHLNNNVRVMFNYIHSEVTDARGTAGADGTVDAFGIRVAAEW